MDNALNILSEGPKSSCDGCPSKNDGTSCNGHFTAVADEIARVFVANQIEYNPADATHNAVVSQFVDKGLQTENGEALRITIPEDRQEWFRGLIAERVTTGLSAATPMP